MNPYNEENLIEKSASGIFTDVLEYGFVNAFKEKFESNFNLDKESLSLGRENSGEVVIIEKLKRSIKKINPGIKKEAVDLVIEKITKDRSVMSLVSANKEVYNLIKNGIDVELTNDEGLIYTERIKIIDFENPNNNDFFLTSQFWVTGEMYKRRADLIGFVNGLPLIFIELKAIHKNLKDAFDNNLKDYKNTIPKLFWYNAFVILSNGIETKIGTITSEFEHFNEWKKINDEGEKGVVSLDTVIKGTCQKDKFLDIFENFILFDQMEGKEIKIVAKNHQYLGVNNAIKSLIRVKENDEERGRLGVFWHTQGSGKSYSMIFFSQKVLRKIEGNYTFVIVTDRKELDKQIYTNFVNVGAVTENMVQAKTINHLRELLMENHRLVFTLIHKFKTHENENIFPTLSNRSDVIVMADEAHRGQYDLLALNMRNALPRASFIGFTGTPLIEGEEQETVETFGNYVSIYDFNQSVQDGATVPLFYENRIPKLNLNESELQGGLEELLDEIEMNEDQEKKLSREFAREYQLITREDRLNEIARDCINHFNTRGFEGKALFVAIDRLTAVKMYNKLKEQPGCPDVAVVISPSRNEVEYFSKQGLDIVPHRKRIISGDLEKKFKNPKDPLKIVIVCNMWLTGFDVPCLSTLYLDKPMKNHNLMQAIARANRVFTGKQSGLIVDYIGIFKSLQKALSIYALGGGADFPIKSKNELIVKLRNIVEELDEFCADNSVEIMKIQKANCLEKISLIQQAVNILLSEEEIKNKFLNLTDQSIRVLSAILPDTRSNEFISQVQIFRAISNSIRTVTKKEVNIEEISDKIENILDKAIETEGYKIKEVSKITDLSKIDFKKLKEYFAKENKYIIVEQLKAEIEKKLSNMLKLNPSRKDFIEKFQKLIDEYNSETRDIERFFDELVNFSQDLNEEDKRNVRESLSEEQLAIFDLLYKKNITEKDKNKIKKIACEILEKLERENKLIIDWRKKQKARADVRVAIRDVIFEGLPKNYSVQERQSCFDFVYNHIYDNYYGEGKSVYTTIN